MNTRRIITIGAMLVTAAGLTAASMGVAAAATNTTLADDNAIVINAAVDPTDAQQALAGYQAATNQQFTITAGPTYSHTPFALVTNQDGTPAASVTGNAKTHQSVEEILSVEHQDSASWSIGGSVEASVGYDLAGIVDAEVSGKISTTDSWESSSTDSQDVWVTALPGKTVWIEASNQVVSFTGTFTFTDPYGRNYEIDNVTITQPASPNGDRFAGTTYKVEEVNSTVGAGLPADTTGGMKPINELPVLQDHIAAQH